MKAVARDPPRPALEAAAGADAAASAASARARRAFGGTAGSGPEATGAGIEAAPRPGPGLEALHQPVRLRFMAMLARHRDVAFAPAREALGVTDGNRASHAQRLAEAGFLEARRALARGGFQLRYRITPAGAQAFAAYVAWLRAVLEASHTADSADAQEGGSPSHTPPGDVNRGARGR